MAKVYSSKFDFDTDLSALGISMPYSESIDILKEKSEIRGKTVRNRLACQAMEGCDGEKSGAPSELTKRRYKRLAEGGAGIIWFEATAVSHEARANPRQLYITADTLDSFKRQVDEIREAAIKKNGYAPLIFMQATHSGRYSKPDGTPAPLIAYNNPIYEKSSPIDSERIVSDSYLDSVGEALIEGARLAEKAGFDGVDIKSCHRYLTAELLSAYERDGRYGTSFANRTRLLRESVKGAMEMCGKDFIVSTRLGVCDAIPYPYGFGVKRDGSAEFDADEPIRLVRELHTLGMPLINITMGNPYFNPHVNRPYAHGGYEPDEHPLMGVCRMLGGIRDIKQAVPDIKIISSALSFLGTLSPHVAAGYIQNGDFDYAGYGRMIFAYPDFASDIIHEGALKKERCCLACSKCTEIMRAGGMAGCPVRDGEAYAPIYKEYCGGKNK